MATATSRSTDGDAEARLSVATLLRAEFNGKTSLTIKPFRDRRCFPQSGRTITEAVRWGSALKSGAEAPQSKRSAKFVSLGPSRSVWTAVLQHHFRFGS